MARTNYRIGNLAPIALPQSVADVTVALGRYQAEVMRGNRAWSGADLAGKAGKYGAVYARSRRAALKRLNAALAPFKLTIKINKGKYGKLTLVWSVA